MDHHSVGSCLESQGGHQACIISERHLGHRKIFLLLAVDGSCGKEDIMGGFHSANRAQDWCPSCFSTTHTRIRERGRGEEEMYSPYGASSLAPA